MPSCPRHTETTWYVAPEGRHYCRRCKAEIDARYRRNPRGKATRSRADARYATSLKGYLRKRKYALRVSREDTLSKLADLAAEEARWQT